MTTIDKITMNEDDLFAHWFNNEYMPILAEQLNQQGVTVAAHRVQAVKAAAAIAQAAWTGATSKTSNSWIELTDEAAMKDLPAGEHHYFGAFDPKGQWHSVRLFYDFGKKIGGLGLRRAMKEYGLSHVLLVRPKPSPAGLSMKTSASTARYRRSAL